MAVRRAITPFNVSPYTIAQPRILRCVMGYSVHISCMEYVYGDTPIRVTQPSLMMGTAT